MEKNKDYYNEIYLSGGSGKEYLKEPKDCIYYPIWNRIIFSLDSREKIFELGCGVGQLAKLLINNKRNYVRGVDFSDIAIQKAKENNREQQDKFLVANLYDEETYDLDYDTIIACEVLEHIEFDLEIINKIKKNTMVYFSVPNFNSQSHVRFFTKIEDIIHRYNKTIQINNPPTYFNINKNNSIYLFGGIKK
jgi:2-polyprenyl-3-methyl-5-hydroxy-6-metoxy-1,4-benzoquinol methylase